MRFSRLLAATTTAGALILTGCSSTPPQPTTQVQAYYEQNKSITPLPTTAPIKIDAALLSAGTKTVIFGDSWTKGTGAARPELGYAHLTGASLGWSNTVLGAGGTGYMNPGTGGVGPFAQRLGGMPVNAEARLVIMQGSVNDQSQDLPNFAPAVEKALNAAKAKFPNAQLVVLGPAPATLPVAPNLRQIDGKLRQTAEARGIPYISPVQDFWVTESNFSEVIDRAQLNHPSTAGHAYLAEQTVKALKDLAG